MVVTSSKSCRENLEAASSIFRVSEIATWRVEMPHNRIAELPKCRNAKHVLAQPVVTTIGHIGGRWRKELVQPSSISEFRGSVREA
jgi:hypothetical protein